MSGPARTGPETGGRLGRAQGIQPADCRRAAFRRAVYASWRGVLRA